MKLKRLCARQKCQKRFTPSRENHAYCSKTCKNRAAQERLRERAKITGKDNHNVR